MLIVGLCFDICDRELIVVEMLEKKMFLTKWS